MVDVWSAQCGECFKWRLIPTEEEFEEIRSNFTDDPFVCSKKSCVSCDDPADIEYNDSRVWVSHKPGIPKTPAGFKRRLVMRKDFSKMDCYYDAPNGKTFRGLNDVSKFLNKYRDYAKDISIADFSFSVPKIMGDTVPSNVGKRTA